MCAWSSWGRIADVSNLEQFVEDASKSVASDGQVTKDALIEIVRLVYNFNGRRHVPETLMHQVLDGASLLLQSPW